MSERNSGGIWKRTNQYGDYFYVQVEIDGQKHAFYGYPNSRKTAGDKFPDFHLKPAAPPKPREEQGPLESITPKDDEGECPF